MSSDVIRDNNQGLFCLTKDAFGGKILHVYLGEGSEWQDNILHVSNLALCVEHLLPNIDVR